MQLGFAGARTFINSKLTPLIVVAALLLGVFAVKMTPREEEPQIMVPMVDIFLPMPGSSPKEIQERVVKPFESKMWEIKGVEYIYSMSRPGMGIITVRFQVGQPMEESLVKLYNKVMSNRRMLPPGAGEPLVSPKSIDDVPILSLTLWSARYDHEELRKVALEVCSELKKSENTAESEVKGGFSRQIRVALDTQRLTAYGLSPVQVASALQKGNSTLISGTFSRENREVLVETSGFLENADMVGKLVVGVYNSRPVHLSDVALVSDNVQEPDNYLFIGLGPGSEKKGIALPAGVSSVPDAKLTDYPAVTISIAKRRGANATWVSDDLLNKVENLKGKVIPSDVQVTVTRNYGDTAREKTTSCSFTCSWPPSRSPY